MLDSAGSLVTTGMKSQAFILRPAAFLHNDAPGVNIPEKACQCLQEAGKHTPKKVL